MAAICRVCRSVARRARFRVEANLEYLGGTVRLVALRVRCSRICTLSPSDSFQRCSGTDHCLNCRYRPCSFWITLGPLSWQTCTAQPSQIHHCPPPNLSPWSNTLANHTGCLWRKRQWRSIRGRVSWMVKFQDTAWTFDTFTCHRRIRPRKTLLRSLFTVR